MFLLSEKEKINFLTIIYTATMFDKQITEEEDKLLCSIKDEIFDISDFEQTDLDIRNASRIAKIINEIKNILPIIYLFNISQLR